MNNFQQPIQNGHLSCLEIGPRSLQPTKPPLTYADPRQISNETGPTSNHSNLVEAEITPNVSEDGPCSLQPKPSLISAKSAQILNEAEPAAANQSSAIQSSDVSENQPTELLSFETAITKGEATYPELIFIKKDCNKEFILEVTHQENALFVREWSYISSQDCVQPSTAIWVQLRFTNPILINRDWKCY